MEDLNLLRAVLSLGFVLGLIGLLAWGVRRFELDKRLLMPSARKSSRLKVEEMLMLDARHKLLLVRRDDVNHLVLISPSSMLLLESGVPSSDMTQVPDA